MPVTQDEVARLAALRGLGILDTGPEAEFDALAQAASVVCGVPISLLSLVDETRQFFKANVGLDGVTGTSRGVSFCSHALLGDDVFEVPDATKDRRFADNVLVTGQPSIRFYAGAPVRLSSGHAVGALCVIDRQPARLDDRQREILRCLARAAGCALDSWRAKRALEELTLSFKANELLLRRNEQFLSGISRVVGAGGWEQDLTTGQLFWSEQFYRILGLDPSVQPSMAAVDGLFAPEARESSRAALERAKATGEPWDLELPLIHDDGKRRWVRALGSVSRPAVVTGALMDITQRVSERQALETANQRLALAMDSGRIGIFDWDIAGDRITWDPWMCRFYGLAPHDTVVTAEQWRGYWHKDDFADIRHAVLAAMEHDAPCDRAFRIVWADGSIHHLHATARVIRDPAGRAIRMIGINVDITERFLAEQLRAERDESDRATRAKSEFLATMSHEIRSPMSGLLGVLELLRATDLDSEQSRMAGMIHNSASLLLAVLNDILDFSKIEAGALSVSLEPAAPRDLVADLLGPHAVAAERKGLSLRWSVAPDVPGLVLTDPLRLRQVLGNLVANAVKFTSVGEISVAVDMVAEASPPMLRVAVRDTGIGIDDAVIGRLFNPFMQAEGSTTRRFGGTGLGLAISSKLARLLDGDLTASSRAGHGSTFTLRLKLRPCAAGPRAAETPPPGPVAPLSQGGMALTVDDDATIRWLTQRQLERLGFRVDVATNGEEGLRKALTAPYDVILTDCHMPLMDGAAMTRAIRAAARTVPVIGLTADVTETQRAVCEAAGMSELVIKPLTLERLAEAIGRHVHGKSEAPSPEATPALRAVPFDSQIYLSMFTPDDADGTGWLDDFRHAARQDVAALSALLTTTHAGLRRSAIRDSAHRLAGASYSVGAMLLGAACRALEQEAGFTETDVEKLLSMNAAVQVQFDAAEAAIEAFLDRAPAALVE